MITVWMMYTGLIAVIVERKQEGKTDNTKERKNKRRNQGNGARTSDINIVAIIIISHT